MTIGTTSKGRVRTGRIGKSGRHGSAFGADANEFQKNLYPIEYHERRPKLRMVLADSIAAMLDADEDLTRFENDELVTVTDTAGKVATGYIKEADVAESLDSELLTNGSMELDSGWASVGSPTTNERHGVVRPGTGDFSRMMATTSVGQGIKNIPFTSVEGALYKLDYWVKTYYDVYHAVQLTDDTYTLLREEKYHKRTWNNIIEYITLLNSGSAGVLSFLSSKYAAYDDFWFDDASLKEVTNLGITGVHIVSTEGGSTRNWANIEAGFDPNNIAEIYIVQP
jgi:hypothetical protein